MGAIVSAVEKGSIAEELEIEAGDELLSIDKQQMLDLIDYKFLCKTELMIIEIKKKNNEIGKVEEIELIELEKDFDEDLGIIFESAVFDKVKPCLNKCIFCFVDQQPDGLRDTLYIKDDDYRLSYLQGTYVTLTNLTQKDKERIEKLRLGPFYISVHTTNPELRIKMLRNPNAGNIFQNLEWLEQRDIPVHLQIVLCPQYNAGDELKRTLNDFKKLKNILSIAIVPVGITKYRKELREKALCPVNKECAIETIEIVEKFNKYIKKHIACCSDEIFALAEKPIPSKKYYGDFAQLEDGVGAMRLLLDDFNERKGQLPSNINNPLKILFVTSQLAKTAIGKIANTLDNIKNLDVEVIAVESKYWGENITVAGLITSNDLIKTLHPFTNLDVNLTVIIPSIMLRQFTQDFLDGKTLNYVKERTGLNFLVINDCYSIKEVVDFILIS